MRYFVSKSQSSKQSHKVLAVKLSVGCAILALILAGCQGGGSSPTPISPTDPTTIPTVTDAPTTDPTAIPTVTAAPTTVPTTIPTATATPTTVPTPIPTATATPISTPIPVANPTPTLTTQSALPENLFLEIVEPANESIVYDSPLAVVGRTTPDAVVSVDGKTAEVNAQGQFIALVSLAPGPNVIEVVASDLNGIQETALLALIYIPGD